MIREEEPFKNHMTSLSEQILLKLQQAMGLTGIQERSILLPKWLSMMGINLNPIKNIIGC